MNKGKAKCDKLKAIRRAIAEANNIDYKPEECTFEGDCNGTCPRCDAEIQQLDRILKQKESNGESVVIPAFDMSDEEEAQNNDLEPEEEVDFDPEMDDDEECSLRNAKGMFPPPLMGDAIFLEDEECDEEEDDYDSEWKEDDEDFDSESEEEGSYGRSTMLRGDAIPMDEEGIDPSLSLDVETGQFVPKTKGTKAN